MRYRQLGNSDLNVSVVGIGTWGMSGQGWESSHTSDDEQSIATIRAAVDAGINFIDTALTYGSGHAEELVGARTPEQVLMNAQAGDFVLNDEDMARLTEASDRVREA